jgi:natural product precursor
MKKLSKKLKLNKETISKLNDKEMVNVKGGFGRNVSELCNIGTKANCRR